jgi:N-acetylglucosamine kinase-like BadF-type ATPase
MMNRVKTASALGVVLSAIALPSVAAVDAAVTTAITEAGTDIAVIGAALIGLAVVAMTYKWLKASFF